MGLDTLHDWKVFSLASKFSRSAFREDFPGKIFVLVRELLRLGSAAVSWQCLIFLPLKNFKQLERGPNSKENFTITKLYFTDEKCLLYNNCNNWFEMYID
jgi:hypothetical protein